MANEEELRAVRVAHAEALRAHGTQAFPNDFRASEAHEASRKKYLEIAQNEGLRVELPTEETLTEGAPSYWLYGRLVAKRGPFLVVRTPLGDAQALVRPELLPPGDAAQLELVDLSDHVLLEGRAVRTKTGAAALRATSFRHVGKALLPPPAKKWQADQDGSARGGLKDVEKRYRERYVDLFANPEVAKVFKARARVVRELRRFLDQRGFLEVETPLLHPLRGGATAKPFRTHHNVLDMELFLRIAPELYLKRLLVGGFDRVYEIGRCFRNEGVSTKHNPEFTMLEFYAAYATYEDLIDLGEQMLRAVDRGVREEVPELTKDRTFELEEPFARVTMRTAIKERLLRAGDKEIPNTRWLDVFPKDAVEKGAIDDATMVDGACAAMLERAQTKDPVVAKQLGVCETYGERIFLLYELLVEPELPKLYRTRDGARSLPVFITEYPFEVSPLARRNDRNPAWTDRFELFIEAREVANAFSELNDPIDQAGRFQAQVANRAKGDEEAMDYDADYIRALEHGMPPAAGFGLGVDRLVMTLTNQASIRDVLFFPSMRPEATP